jgi:hypothetical protein
MISAHQPGSQPIDIPEAIPNPAVPGMVPKPAPAPKEPDRVPAPQRAQRAAFPNTQLIRRPSAKQLSTGSFPDRLGNVGGAGDPKAGKYDRERRVRNGRQECGPRE